MTVLRHLRGGAVAVAILGLAIPAAAQVVDAAAVRASHAATLIAEAGATGVFHAEPHDLMTAVRHDGSGLRCLFDPARSGRIIIYPAHPPLTRTGEDVACDAALPLAAQTFYATRYAQQRTLEAAFADAVLALRLRHPEARPVATPPLDIPAENLPRAEWRTAGFVVLRADGQEIFTRVSVAIVHGWEIKQRFSAPSAASNTSADISWIGALRDIERVRARTAVVVDAAGG